MKVQWIVISALLFALITAVFAVINVEAVQVNFLFTQTKTPLILVILASTLLGGLTVGLFGITRQFKMKRHIRKLENEVSDLSATIASLESPIVPFMKQEDHNDDFDPEPESLK
ncbi:DUF1049 domain-containing protein [Paenibacillaceae bacterium]|nr:DUF1049 domain-containing protein [Paenibacillaceae bacterium]